MLCFLDDEKIEMMKKDEIPAMLPLYLEQEVLRRVGREPSNAEVFLLRAVTHGDPGAGLQHVAVQLVDRSGGLHCRGVFGVGEAAVLPAEVHHQPELPERPHGAEQGDQQVLVGVPWDVVDEDLAVGSWGGAVPT